MLSKILQTFKNEEKPEYKIKKNIESQKGDVNVV